jgi:hypothetical protein
VDDQCGVITAVETTAGDGAENQQLLTLVDQHEAHTGETVRTVVGDAQYGTADNFAACEHRGIRSHMNDLRAKRNDSGRRGIFPETDFRYDEANGTYICPAGERLKPIHTVDRGMSVFRSNPKICRQCVLRPQCMKSKRGVRTIKRHVAYEAIQRARARSRSGQARQDRRRRRHLVEGSFADAANCHGFKRARWRGLDKQTIQDRLIASCQNIRILVRHTRRAEAASMVVGIAGPIETGPTGFRNAWNRLIGHITAGLAYQWEKHASTVTA